MVTLNLVMSLARVAWPLDAMCLSKGLELLTLSITKMVCNRGVTSMVGSNEVLPNCLHTLKPGTIRVAECRSDIRLKLSPAR